MCWWVPEPSWSITFGEQSSRLGEGFPNARRKPFIREGRRALARGTHISPGADPGDHSASLTERIKDYDCKLEDVAEELYPETKLS